MTLHAYMPAASLNTDAQLLPPLCHRGKLGLSEGLPRREKQERLCSSSLNHISSLYLPENTLPPQVHLLPPPSEELALNERVSLTCLVRGFNPKDVLVRWLHGNHELPRESYLVSEPLKEPSEGPITYSVTSVMRVSAESWKQGDQYSCMVGHEALPMNFTQKTIDRLSGKPTNVNVSVILSESDGVCY